MHMECVALESRTQPTSLMSPILQMLLRVSDIASYSASIGGTLGNFLLIILLHSFSPAPSIVPRRQQRSACVTCVPLKYKFKRGIGRGYPCMYMAIANTCRCALSIFGKYCA